MAKRIFPSAGTAPVLLAFVECAEAAAQLATNGVQSRARDLSQQPPRPKRAAALPPARAMARRERPTASALRKEGSSLQIAGETASSGKWRRS
jgi:hypothetical protein